MARDHVAGCVLLRLHECKHINASETPCNSLRNAHYGQSLCFDLHRACISTPYEESGRDPESLFDIPPFFLVQAGVIPAGDAIACVPTALAAICLNSNGAERVKTSGALDCLIPVLTNPAYIKALNVGLP